MAEENKTHIVCETEQLSEAFTAVAMYQNELG